MSRKRPTYPGSAIPADPYEQLAQGMSRPHPEPYRGPDAETVIVFSDGQYLESFDPDFCKARPPSFPTGSVKATPDIRRAKRFKTMTDAFVEWTRQSTTVPLRPDGQPNKPLTAFTVNFETVAPLKPEGNA